MFSYDPAHRVIICSDCGTCLIPGRASQEQHLRAKPHQLCGETLKTTLQLFSSYDAGTAEELKAGKPRAEDKVVQIKDLAAYDGFHCLQLDCGYCTRHFLKMKAHGAAHKKKSLDRKLGNSHCPRPRSSGKRHGARAGVLKWTTSAGAK